MDKAKVIHNVLKQVDWDFIFSCAKHMKYKLGKKRLTKEQLILDLTDILQNVLESKKNKLIVDFWTITAEYTENNEVCLEVIFTPIIIWSDSLSQGKTKKTNEERLKERLELALEIEDYTKAAEIKKSLDKLQSKLK